LTAKGRQCGQCGQEKRTRSRSKSVRCCQVKSVRYCFADRLSKLLTSKLLEEQVLYGTGTLVPYCKKAEFPSWLAHPPPPSLNARKFFRLPPGPRLRWVHRPALSPVCHGSATSSAPSISTPCRDAPLSLLERGPSLAARSPPSAGLVSKSPAVQSTLSPCASKTAARCVAPVSRLPSSQSSRARARALSLAPPASSLSYACSHPCEHAHACARARAAVSATTNCAALHKGGHAGPDLQH